MFDPAINASANFTLVLPKERLRAAGVEDQVDELYLADMSAPPELYDKAPRQDDTVLFG